MVIAGGSFAQTASGTRRRRFNGAGDGDRRRVRTLAKLAQGLGVASTEPAMVIAGGAQPPRFACRPSQPLQRSRRW